MSSAAPPENPARHSKHSRRTANPGLPLLEIFAYLPVASVGASMRANHEWRTASATSAHFWDALRVRDSTHMRSDIDVSSAAATGISFGSSPWAGYRLMAHARTSDAIDALNWRRLRALKEKFRLEEYFHGSRSPLEALAEYRAQMQMAERGEISWHQLYYCVCKGAGIAGSTSRAETMVRRKVANLSDAVSDLEAHNQLLFGDGRLLDDKLRRQLGVLDAGMPFGGQHELGTPAASALRVRNLPRPPPRSFWQLARLDNDVGERSSRFTRGL